MYAEELITVSQGIGSKAGLEDHFLAEAEPSDAGEGRWEVGQARGCLG